MTTRPEPRAVVVARLLLVASTTAALAAGAHVLGGGALPGRDALVALLALTCAAAVPVARRPVTWATGLPFAAGAGLVLHGALSWLAHVSRTAVTGHAQHGAPSVVLVPPGAGVPATSTVMLAAHAAATVLTVALLVALDRAVRGIGTWWSHVTPHLPSPVTVVTGQAVRWAADAPVVAPRDLVLARCARRRGPPVGSPVPA